MRTVTVVFGGGMDRSVCLGTKGTDRLQCCKMEWNMHACMCMGAAFVSWLLYYYYYYYYYTCLIRPLVLVNYCMYVLLYHTDTINIP